MKNVSDKVAAAKRLIDSCNKKILMSGYDVVKLRGVENLTRADLDTIIMYCEYFIDNKTIGGLMPPHGGVASVLKQIGLY